MTRAAWDELAEGGVAPIANAGYYKDVEEAILWADRVVKIAERAVMIHSHASIYCTQCFVDAIAVKKLRAALEGK